MGLKTFGHVTCIGIALFFTSAVQAQSDPAKGYPSKLIRLIEPGGPGSMTDATARGIAPSLSQALGQPVVIDSRTGANGILAMEACSNAAPDGYTLCLPNNSQISLNPLVYANLPYDPVRGLAPVIYIASNNGVIVVHSAVPANSMRELVEYAKANPGKVNWASWGPSSFAYLTLAWVQSNTGATFLHVPYKTPMQALQSVIAGETQATQNNPQIAMPMIKAGKLKVLVVAGHKRYSLLPEVPSFTEAGFDLDYAGWYGMFAPAGIPKAIVQRLNTEVGKLIADPIFVEKFMTPFASSPVGGTAEEFMVFLEKDRETAAKLAKIANLKPQ